MLLALSNEVSPLVARRLGEVSMNKAEEPRETDVDTEKREVVRLGIKWLLSADGRDNGDEIGRAHV